MAQMLNDFLPNDSPNESIGIEQSPFFPFEYVTLCIRPKHEERMANVMLITKI